MGTIHHGRFKSILLTLVFFLLIIPSSIDADVPIHNYRRTRRDDFQSENLDLYNSTSKPSLSTPNVDLQTRRSVKDYIFEFIANGKKDELSQALISNVDLEPNSSHISERQGPPLAYNATNTTGEVGTNFYNHGQPLKANNSHEFKQQGLVQEDTLLQTLASQVNSESKAAHISKRQEVPPATSQSKISTSNGDLETQRNTTDPNFELFIDNLSPEQLQRLFHTLTTKQKVPMPVSKTTDKADEAETRSHSHSLPPTNANNKTNVPKKQGSQTMNTPDQAETPNENSSDSNNWLKMDTPEPFQIFATNHCLSIATIERVNKALQTSTACKTLKIEYDKKLPKEEMVTTKIPRCPAAETNIKKILIPKPEDQNCQPEKKKKRDKDDKKTTFEMYIMPILSAASTFVIAILKYLHSAGLIGGKTKPVSAPASALATATVSEKATRKALTTQTTEPPKASVENDNSYMNIALQIAMEMVSKYEEEKKKTSKGATTKV